MSSQLIATILLINLLSILIVVVADYRIGVGIADCTGPSAEIVFMGYAKSKQKGCGIHLRQFSRAFVFDDGKKRVAFVSVDAAMMANGVRKAVIRKLKHLNESYNEHNLLLSGTHTHGAPGGFLMDLMYDIPNYGFVRETFNALVTGITKSIIKAHENMVEAKIYMTSGEVMDANINRSPTSYLLNPEEEREMYKYNVDKDLIQMQIYRSSDNSPIGAINWFSVHPTSMNNTNCLVTTDNLGYASILFEERMNDGAMPGKGSFVGAFASTSSGDVSPNIDGPRCLNTGESCDNITSTCKGEAHFCVASGPGKNMFESTHIIAHRLFDKANELWDNKKRTEIEGSVKYVHQYVDMPKQSAFVGMANGTKKKVHGCLPAMGYSFAAGTTDGPGEFDFSQGTLSSNYFWNTIRDFIFQPTPEDVACHRPKPILINTGRISLPYQWQPKIVSTQILMIGDVILAAVPGEFTTMSGRRLRNVLREVVLDGGGSKTSIPIIAGLSNIYTSYIATPEEYELQRYEGASTIYGPHTLDLYLDIYQNLAIALINDKPVAPGPTPPDFSSSLISLVPPVLFDFPGWKRRYGKCIQEPPPTVHRGTTVEVKFVSGHPRNNVMHEQTFLSVEKRVGDGWVLVATDANWETRFIWTRTLSITGGSEATVRWDIKKDADTGTYRIGHFGYYKYILGGVFPYEGFSRNFNVI